MKIIIPSQFEKITLSKEVDIKGTTVGEVINNFLNEFDLLQPRLKTKDGSLNRFVNIYVNDEDIRFLKGENTPVKETDVLSIIPSIAGG